MLFKTLARARTAFGAFHLEFIRTSHWHLGGSRKGKRDQSILAAFRRLIESGSTQRNSIFKEYLNNELRTM